MAWMPELSICSDRCSDDLSCYYREIHNLILSRRFLSCHVITSRFIILVMFLAEDSCPVMHVITIYQQIHNLSHVLSRRFLSCHDRAADRPVMN